MGESGKPPGDWKTERISMTHLASFSRSSSYVRSLVRQQFHHQSDQPNTAWERLRERLSKQHGSFEFDDEMPNFMKKRENTGLGNDDENISDNEDDDDDEETYVFLKSASPSHRSSVATEAGKDKKGVEKNKKSVSANNDSASELSLRRLSAPPTSLSNVVEPEKQYTLPSTDAHSKILNRRLSLAENVIKNYSKYIRTPDESKRERNTLAEVHTENEKSEQQPLNEQPLIAAITEEESSPVVDVKLVNCASPASSYSSDFLAVDTAFIGSSHTVPPSPAAKSDTTFFNVPFRRNSLSEVISVDFSLTRSVTDVTPKASKDKLVADTNKLPRLLQTASKAKREKLPAKNRDEAIEKLREEHEKLKKRTRLNRRVGKRRDTVYRQIVRDQEQRARESEIFHQEMEQITKTLKSINHRLDERIKVLDCADPPKVNARLQRILQVALAGVPLKNV